MMAMAVYSAKKTERTRTLTLTMTTAASLAMKGFVSTEHLITVGWRDHCVMEPEVNHSSTKAQSSVWMSGFLLTVLLWSATLRTSTWQERLQAGQKHSSIWGVFR